MSPDLRNRTPLKQNGPNTPSKSAKSNAVALLDTTTGTPSKKISPLVANETPSKNTRSKASSLVSTLASGHGITLKITTRAGTGTPSTNTKSKASTQAPSSRVKANLKDQLDAVDTLKTSPSTSPASVSSSSPKSSPKLRRSTRKVSPKSIKTISPKKPASPTIARRTRRTNATPLKTPAKQTPSKRKQPKKTPAKSPSGKNTPAKRTPAKRTPARNTTAKKTPGKNTPDEKLFEEQAVELNTYQKYKHALSTTIKSKLVFRDEEASEIRSFLEEHLSKKTSSSIYISGPPGTGKTASVTAILDELKDKYTFESLFYNGMTFTSPTNFFKKLLNDLNYGDSTAKELTPQIVQALSQKKAKLHVLVLDEIDILDSRHQEMLYTIFNLPMYKSTKVIIVGIANALDFTSKKLVRFHSLNISPMKEVTFQPYDPEKLAGILKARISELACPPLFHPAAIGFCAKKVASLSGDARKALEILRRSVELVEHEVLKESKACGALKEQNNQELSQPTELKQVSIPHVQKILNQVYNDKVIEATTDDDYNFPIQQKIVLCMILLLARDGNRNPELGKCYDRLIRIDKERSLKLEISTAGIFLDMCEMLEGKSFIAIQRSKDLRCTKLSLTISEEEARELLKKNVVTFSILNS